MKLIKDIKLLIIFQTNHIENSHCFTALNEDKIKEKILSQMSKAQCHIKINLLVKHLNLQFLSQTEFTTFIKELWKRQGGKVYKHMLLLQL